MTLLTCEHDNAKLQQKQNPKSGTFYQCPKCKCTYKLVIIANDKDCYNKRYKPQPAPAKEKKSK